MEESEAYPGSTGTLYPTLEARLLDTDLQDVSPGEAGELCLRGPTVMKYDLGSTVMIRSLTKTCFVEDTGTIKQRLQLVSRPMAGTALVILHK